MQNEKSSKYDDYESKIMNLYNSIEEVKENNNNKFNDVKEQILLIQKTTDEEVSKRESVHNEFMEYMKKMEEKIFEKFDSELNSKRDLECKASHYLEEKINLVKNDLQTQSKTRFEMIENLEYYFEAEIPKIQEAYNFIHNEREQNDNIAINNLKDELQKYIV